MDGRILSCRVCGGKLDIVQGGGVIQCQYCGQYVNIPSLDERLLNQYNRGTTLRRKHEYDNAYRIYQRIIAEYPNEAEAYWGLVLCRYGIDYVDAQNNEKKPTLRRMQYQSILKDEDFQRALALADDANRAIYQASANEIAQIQEKYISIVQSETPYDVFICYKDTQIDDPGKPTMDRAYAQQIYDALTKEGYKVFFSHVTLENKLGIEYEPYIFAALNSATVMLTVSTCRDNLESTWVKNEWSRFLDIMQEFPQKKLIPVFRDMDAYDLPKEFVALGIQGVDYGRLDAQRLILEKVVQILQTPSNTQAQIANLLRIAGVDLRSGMPEKAADAYNLVLRMDPKNYSAALGLLVIEMNLQSEDELAQCGRQELDRCASWNRALANANEQQRAWLEAQLTQNRYETALQRLMTEVKITSKDELGTYNAGELDQCASWKPLLACADQKQRAWLNANLQKNRYETALKRLLTSLRLESRNDLAKFGGKPLDENKYWAPLLACANEKQKAWLDEQLTGNLYHVIKREEKEIDLATMCDPVTYRYTYEKKIERLLQLIAYWDANAERWSKYNYQSGLKDTLYWVVNRFVSKCKVPEYDRIEKWAKGEELQFYKDSQVKIDALVGFMEFLKRCDGKCGISLSDEIHRCEVRAGEIRAWRKKGISRLNRIKRKRVFCALLAIAAGALAYWYRADPVRLAGAVAASLFFLLSIHQVEPTFKHLFFRVLFCCPYGLGAWRIASATGTFSKILRWAVWGGIGALLAFYVLLELLDAERDDEYDRRQKREQGGK